jgi:hypothetical protein
MFTKDPDLGRVMDITMLGPRGAGKTSLLVSLYDQFQEVVGSTPLEMSASDPVTRNDLEVYREQLREFAKGVQRDPGISNTPNIREHIFGLGTQGKRPPQMHLRFTDGPGELLNRSGPDRDRLDAAVGRSGVLLIAVDSPALMEDDQRHNHNDRVNKPELVMEFVRDALAAGGQRLVVFVPLKCEKYVASAGGARELRDAVRQRYAILIKKIADPNGQPDEGRTGAVLTPVQTVGSMRFSRFERDGDGYREVFRLAKIGGEYSPRDTDQPLRWMLRFAVNAYRNRSRWWGVKLVDWWNETDVKLTGALEKFAADCKERDGVEIRVRHPYLDLP